MIYINEAKILKMNYKYKLKFCYKCQKLIIGQNLSKKVLP